MPGWLFPRGPDRVDAFSHKRPDVDVVERKPGEIPGEDLNACADVRSLVEYKSWLAPHHAEAAFAAFEIRVDDGDVQAFCEGLEFLQ